MHPLLRSEFDAATPVVQEVTEDSDRLRMARVWLLSADGAHATEWGTRMDMHAAMQEKDRLLAWARPASVELDVIFEGLSKAQQRIMTEDLADLGPGRPFHMVRMHMRISDATWRVLGPRKGLSDGHRYTDLGWYLRLYMRSTHGITRPA